MVKRNRSHIIYISVLPTKTGTMKWQKAKEKKNYKNLFAHLYLPTTLYPICTYSKYYYSISALRPSTQTICYKRRHFMSLLSPPTTPSKPPLPQPPSAGPVRCPARDPQPTSTDGQTDQCSGEIRFVRAVPGNSRRAGIIYDTRRQWPPSINIELSVSAQRSIEKKKININK